MRHFPGIALGLIKINHVFKRFPATYLLNRLRYFYLTYVDSTFMPISLLCIFISNLDNT
jgi:hypothetical protein